MKITLYGRRGDAHTVAFKNFLNSTNEIYDYKDISVDAKAKEHTKELYGGQVKFPTLFVNDEVYLTPTSDDFNKIMKNLKLRG